MYSYIEIVTLERFCKNIVYFSISVLSWIPHTHSSLRSLGDRFTLKNKPEVRKVWKGENGENRGEFRPRQCDIISRMAGGGRSSKNATGCRPVRPEVARCAVKTDQLCINIQWEVPKKLTLVVRGWKWGGPLASFFLILSRKAYRD